MVGFVMCTWHYSSDCDRIYKPWGVFEVWTVPVSVNYIISHHRSWDKDTWDKEAEITICILTSRKKRIYTFPSGYGQEVREVKTIQVNLWYYGKRVPNCQIVFSHLSTSPRYMTHIWMYAAWSQQPINLPPIQISRHIGSYSSLNTKQFYPFITV